MSFRAMRRRCFNNNTSSCWPRGTPLRKLPSTSENVKIIITLEGIEIEGQEEEEAEENSAQNRYQNKKKDLSF